MAEKEIIWSSRAQKEFYGVLEYYIDRNENPDYSLELMDKIEMVTELISVYPNLGILNDDNLTRTFIIENYSIIYEHSANRIMIYSFWDDRQNPLDKFPN